MFMRKPFVFALVGAHAAFAAAKPTLASKQYETLLLGEILPEGWLYDQLVVQTEGVAGHMHEFYDLVAKSDWIGGHSYYSYLEEAGSYWFNAMVPNSVLVKSTELYEKSLEFYHYVLDTQDESGWLGPEVGTDKPRYLWGRYPFFFGAIQLVEYDPSLEPRFVEAMHRFIQLANDMLKRGEGVEHWASTRWEDFALALQWIFDKHPDGKEELLIDTMQRLKWSGAPWEDIFSEELFPKEAVENLENPWDEDLFWHGVNLAEGMKALPATYRFTHNASDLKAASDGWDLMFRYHGRPSGAFNADELLSGLEANRGSELCLVVELMFSGSFLFQVSGDLKYADRVERVTYNALPATITADMWGRQYLQQQNQVAAKNMTPNPFPEDGPDSNIFGLEPNYPCCTVNFPQGWPKFITNAFVTTTDKTALTQVYIGPMKVETVLAGGNTVHVTVSTQYPFSDTVHVAVIADKPFLYKMRIPGWVSDEGLRVLVERDVPYSVGDDELESTHGDARFLYLWLPAGASKIQVELPAEISIEERPHKSVAVHRGPLNYAFDIKRTETILKTDPREARAVDLQYDAVADWQYAIDPTTLRFYTDEETELPTPIWDYGLAPIWMTVRACPIEWPLGGDTFAAHPPESPACVGEERQIVLSPYGTTKLRISEFPVFQSERRRTEMVGDKQFPIHGL